MIDGFVSGPVLCAVDPSAPTPHVVLVVGWTTGTEVPSALVPVLLEPRTGETSAATGPVEVFVSRDEAELRVAELRGEVVPPARPTRRGEVRETRAGIAERLGTPILDVRVAHGRPLGASQDDR